MRERRRSRFGSRFAEIRLGRINVDCPSCPNSCKLPVSRAGVALGRRVTLDPVASSARGRLMRMGKKRADRPNAEFGQTPGREPVDSKIEINERAGLIRVVDSRVFRPERREWCRALA